MSDIRFISDLHLGHKKILEFSTGRAGTDTVSHSEWLVKQWNSVVEKRDHVYVLGDVCFDREHLKYLTEMRGLKTLILGNHDKFSLETYMKYFHKIKGFFKRDGFWISHAPIHPDELRGLKQIHGHVHQHSIKDDRYVNVCVEVLDGKPKSFNEIKN